MASRSHFYRRSSGIYAVCLVVPQRLRAALGKREIHASTRTTVLAIAKAVEAGFLAHWCMRLLRLDLMDITQVMLGSPILGGGGTLGLENAAAVSGFTDTELLQKAEEVKSRR